MFWEVEKVPTVRESPKAAMTLISAAFTNSTKPNVGKETEMGESRLSAFMLAVLVHLTEGGVSWGVDIPEEGTEGDGVMSGHWKTGCLKLTGRVFSGNICKSSNIMTKILYSRSFKTYFE